MPSTRHSFNLLLAVTVLVGAVCVFVYWQRQQKEKKTSLQFAELAASRPRHGSSPEQQKTLLHLLSDQRDAAATEDLLCFHGIPYRMFTRNFPDCKACYMPPDAFCLFPEGKALVISACEDQTNHTLHISRNGEGTVEDGNYLRQSFQVGTWRIDSAGKLMILTDTPVFRGRIYRDGEGIFRLEEIILPEEDEFEQEGISAGVEDEEKIIHVPRQYRAAHIPAETRKLCGMAAPLLEALELRLSLEPVEQAIREMASILRVEERKLRPFRLSGEELEPPVLHLPCRGGNGVRYELHLDEASGKAEAVELFSLYGMEMTIRKIPLQTDLSLLRSIIGKAEEFLHDLSSSDRHGTKNLSITLPDPDTLTIRATDVLRPMSGNMSMYTFRRTPEGWKMINIQVYDCC